MKKLTAEEILTIIEETGISVDSFAYGEFLEMDLPEGFEYSDKSEVARKVKDKAYERYKAHPYYSLDWQEKRNTEEPIDSLKLKKEYSDLPSEYDIKKLELLTFLGLGKVIEVEQYGGEDMGSTWYSIKHFVDHDVYIRTDGHYQSYNGTDFYEGYGKEVKPREKTITVFE